MAASLNIAALVAWTLVMVVFSYAICGIPFGLVIARVMGNVDVRNTGSGNIGTTNVARSVGKTAAILTLLCDLGKGLVCMVLARFLLSVMACGTVGFSPLLSSGEGLAAMCAVYAGCILGHVFSPYLHFHGGKGIAVGFGAGLGLWWPIGLGLLAVFVVFAVPSRYVSFGSVMAAVSLPIQCALWGFPPAGIAFIAVVALVVVWAHRENISKLVRGEERKFSFHKKGEGEPSSSDAAATSDTLSKDAEDLSDGDEVEDAEVSSGAHFAKADTGNVDADTSSALDSAGADE